jgi:acetolactate synthase-1/2/3 large subunit
MSSGVFCRLVDYIVEHLPAFGAHHVFGVYGANIEDLYDAAHFSAAAMADGYSRAGVGPGVVAATSGGGALNTVAALGESLASRVPVLALIGQPPKTLGGRGAFQDMSGVNGALDSEAPFSAVSVLCRRVETPADIVTALPQAVSAATRIRGPAVSLIPKDVQQGMVDGAGATRQRLRWPVFRKCRPVVLSIRAQSWTRAARR